MANRTTQAAAATRVISQGSSEGEGGTPMLANASLNAETLMAIGTAKIMGRKQSASIRKHILSTLDMKPPWVGHPGIVGPGMRVGQDLRMVSQSGLIG